MMGEFKENAPPFFFFKDLRRYKGQKRGSPSRQSLPFENTKCSEKQKIPNVERPNAVRHDMTVWKGQAARFQEKRDC